MATKYQEVADTVRKRIENGTYKVGELIPDQTTLAAEFKVNRLTVKKALDGLASEGLIYKQSGLGTYVRGKIPFVNHERDVTVDDSEEHIKNLGLIASSPMFWYLTFSFRMKEFKKTLTSNVSTRFMKSSASA